MLAERKGLLGLRLMEALVIVNETQRCGSEVLGHWKDWVHFPFEGLVRKLKFCTVSWCLESLWENGPQSKGDPSNVHQENVQHEQNTPKPPIKAAGRSTI